MSITFDVEKDKKIAMMVETSGIEDNKKLDFTFSIIVDGIKYGFPCVLEDNKVNICIPALSKVISGLKGGKYMASLDVTGDNKYFMQPFKEEVLVVREPKINVVSDSSHNLAEEIGATISRIIDEDIVTDDKNNINIVDDKGVDTTVKSGRIDKIFK